MICSLSGQQTNAPVVSKKSGKVFEKSVLEAWVAEKGTDPITNENLSKDDIVTLDISLETAPLTEISIPRTLESLNVSYNSLILENYQLRQELAKTRQELSTQMYRNDAAVRVLSHMKQERDEARQALVALTGAEPEQEPTLVYWVEGSLTRDQFTEQIDAKKKQIVANRKSGNRKLERSKLSPTVSRAIINAFDASTHNSQILVRRKHPLPKYSLLLSFDDLESYKPEPSKLEPGWPLWGAGGEISMLIDNQLVVGSAKYTFDSPPKQVQFHPATECYAAQTDTGIEFISFASQPPSKVGEILVKATEFTLHPDGGLVVYATEDNKIIFFSLLTLEEAASISTESGPRSIVASNLGYIAAYITADGVYSVDLRRGPLVSKLETGDYESLAFDNSGMLLAATGATGTKLWKYDFEDQKMELAGQSETSGTNIMWAAEEAVVFEEK